MFKFLFKLLCVFVLLLFVVGGCTVALIAPADAVSKSCKRNSHTVVNTMVRKYEDRWSGKRRNYTTKGWVTYCGRATGAKVWKVGVSSRFPKDAHPCRNYNSGIRHSVTFRPGGSSVSLTKNCENDGYFRKVVKTDIFVPELIAPPQPHLDRLLTIDSNVKAMWGRGSADHSKNQNVTVQY